MAMRR